MNYHYSKVKALAGTMSASELQAWKRSSSYALAMVEDSRSADEKNYWIVEAAQRLRAESIALYEAELAKHIRDCEDEDRSWTRQELVNYAKKLTERSLIDSGKVPPTFTGWFDCPVCGVVPAPIFTEECPWDGTEWGEIWAAEWEVLSEEQQYEIRNGAESKNDLIREALSKLN